MDYSFTLNQVIRIGKPCEIKIRDFTMRSFKVTHMVCNVPCPNFVLLSNFQIDAILPEPMFYIDNTPVEVVDSFEFSGLMAPNGIELKKHLWCNHGAATFGKYTGLIPEKYKLPSDFVIAFTMYGVDE